LNYYLEEGIIMKIEIAKDNIFLMFSWKLKKMYEKSFILLAEELQLTQGEIDILLFLFNNKPFDTAKDIVQYRYISKSMVSKSIDSLLKKDYLSCETDSADKRNIHLRINPVAIPVVNKLLAVQKSFMSVLFNDITENEYEEMKRMLNKIMNNFSMELEDKSEEEKNGINT
jgi:DNA-binding MarR family transcriptional regulator